MIAEKQNRKVGAILKIVDHQEDEISNFGMVPTMKKRNIPIRLRLLLRCYDPGKTRRGYSPGY